MPDEPETYIDRRGAELMQLAALVGCFHDALRDLRVPDMLIHDLITAWFAEELDNIEVNVDDD